MENSLKTTTIPVDCHGECSRAVRKQPEEECEDIFLSHSGFQKSFVEQLHRDLHREHLSSFLDKDPHCLPKGKPFPSRILSSARNCKVAVLVLSPEFLSAKWPMLELSAIVDARKFINPDMAILPLFFKISVKTLNEKIKKRDLLPKWKEFQEEDKRINCEEWDNALKEICKFNGMEYHEDEGEVFYRDQIVDRISLLLPPNLKYDDSLVQGKIRLCQEVDRLFEMAEWRNGVRTVGLYGIAGSGKTTISMSLCNFYSRKFKGKVFHVEFDRETCVETQKQILKALTDASDNLLNSVTSKEQGSVLLRQRMPNHKVFMAIDNISDITVSIEAAQSYLSAGFKEGSMILLTARSPVVLERLLREESLLSHVPFLEDEEAMAILLKLTHVELSDLTCAEREVARDCIRKCRFGGTYHPLAIRAFGAYLFDRFGSRLLDWNEIPDIRDSTGSEVEEVFSVFELSFKDLNCRYIDVFMLVALYLPHSWMGVEQALGWLAVVCNESIGCVRDVVNNLKKKGLIEEEDIFGHIRVHSLIRDFAESKANGTWRSWWCFRGREEVPTRFKQTLLYDKFCLQAMKFTNCSMPLSSYNFELFANVMALHLESICQLRSLNLRPLQELRSLVIRDCRELEEIEGIEHLSSVAWIQVDGYNSLIKAPRIEGMKSLRHFHWECWGVEKRRDLVTASVETPTTTRLGDLRKCIVLEYIHIRCQSLEEFPKLEALHNLQKICFADCCRVTTGPDLSGSSRLQYADFDRCSAMTTGPDLSGCSQLRRAYFDGCSAMTAAPDLSGCLQLQDAIFSSCSSMTTGPDLSGCSQLKYADFDGCSAMTSGPDLSGCSQLQDTRFDGCSAMTSGPNLSGCSQLRYVHFTRCSAMTKGPDLSGCSELQDAHFHGWSAMIAALDVGLCIRLNFLSLEGMESLGGLNRFTALRYLDLIDCGINEATGITNCRDLEVLNATRCRGLTGLFLSFADLSSLKIFTLRHCEGVVDPPDLTNCRHLNYVEIRDCSGLTRFPSFAGICSLRRIILRECQAVDEPPDLSGCTGLQEIELRDNPKMERLPWMLDCTSLWRLDLSWGIAVYTNRTPQELRTCPIFRHGHSLTKRFRLHLLANKHYRFAKIRVKHT